MMPSFFKIQDGGGGYLENWENRYCILIASFVFTYEIIITPIFNI